MINKLNRLKKESAEDEDIIEIYTNLLKNICIYLKEKEIQL